MTEKLFTGTLSKKLKRNKSSPWYLNRTTLLIQDSDPALKWLPKSVKFEPRRQKTGLRGFRPGPTQTGLYSHRRWLEAWNFVFRKGSDCTIRCSENKDADQLRGYREADLRLCFRICKNPVFSRRGSFQFDSCVFILLHVLALNSRFLNIITAFF